MVWCFFPYPHVVEIFKMVSQEYLLIVGNMYVDWSMFTSVVYRLLRSRQYFDFLGKKASSVKSARTPLRPWRVIHTTAGAAHYVQYVRAEVIN